MSPKSVIIPVFIKIHFFRIRAYNLSKFLDSYIVNNLCNVDRLIFFINIGIADK